MKLQYLVKRVNFNQTRWYMNSQFLTLFSYILNSKTPNRPFSIANISSYLKVGSITINEYYK